MIDIKIGGDVIKKISMIWSYFRGERRLRDRDKFWWIWNAWCGVLAYFDERETIDWNEEFDGRGRHGGELARR